MSYSKTILCLANSRRPDGRCVAGKEVVDGGFGEWVRPISARDSEEVSEEERRYENGRDPRVLDLIKIPMLEPRPGNYQTENHVIDDRRYWEKIGSANWDDVVAAVDEIPGALWENVGSTRYGINDKIPEQVANRLTSSLCLVRPNGIVINVAKEGGDFGPPKRKVRVTFDLNGTSYKWVVTDPIVERQYLAQGNGDYPIEDALICISLSGLFHGYAYKLAATIITST